MGEAVTVLDELNTPWSRVITAFTPKQLEKIERLARRIIEGSGYGNLVIEFQNGKAVMVCCQETLKL